MIDLSRRGFLGSLLAAPFIVRSGILMPVKQILRPAIATWLEGSIDNENWTPIMRVVSRAGIRPTRDHLKIPGTDRLYAFHRTVIDLEWKAAMEPGVQIVREMRQARLARYSA